MVWNIWEILLIIIGLGLFAALFLARSGAKFPMIKKHETATLVIALIAIFLAFMMVTGVLSVTQTSTTVTQQTGPTYDLTYYLGNVQGATAASNTATTVILASKIATINGVSGIETTANLVYNGSKYNGNFVVGADHNATIGQAQYSVTLYRTDTNVGNISFSVSAVGIPTLTNSTTAKTYPLVVETSAGQYEVSFANNTQSYNIYVHTIAVGGTVTFWVTVNYGVTAVQAMSQYQFESFNLNIAFGSGQSISIPNEIVRAL
jgi:hypothetical protein